MTPVRRQYLQIKKQFPETIVFFRLGDFYETFDGDAKIVSDVCQIVLTGREMGDGERVPLAGVPYHAVENYLARLIQAGHKVAIVEQTTTEPVKGLMEREVQRVVTPGTVVEPNLLQDKANNFLAAIFIQENRAGIAHADITTGEFAATEVDARDLLMELDRLQPAEVLFLTKNLQEKFTYPTTHVSPLNDEAATRILLEQFKVGSLDGFGLQNMALATRAAAGIVRYLQENQRGALGQLRALRVYATDSFMTLDPPTRRNLELTSAMRGGGQKFSLLGMLDETRTAMGGRLLRQWLIQPLRDMDALNARLERVDAFFHDNARREHVRNVLKQIGDIERLTNRVQQNIASPREVKMLGVSLEMIPALNRALADDRSPFPVARHSSLDPLPEVSALIAKALVADPPANLSNGGVIAPNYSAELDSITHAARNAKDWVAALEKTERERSGIKSLKVGYNRVFGYYIEITTPNLPQAPKDYIRKQTLTNAERFITPELKEYEALILNAEERLVELETTLFRALCGEISQYAARLMKTAQAIAELDVYAALAEVAIRQRYARPELVAESVIQIRGGRHPVVENRLRDEPFVPNDVSLNADELIHVITGPNMSGKCVVGDTLVFTARGLVPIRSLIPHDALPHKFTPLEARVHSLNGERNVTHGYAGGTQETIRLKTRIGYQLEGTPEHRVWARSADGIEGWKELGEITKNDFVAIERNIGLWGNKTTIHSRAAQGVKSSIRYTLPNKLDADLAYFLGLLVGDGTCTYQNGVQFTNTDQFLICEFKRIAERLFKYQVGEKANGKDFFITSKQIRVFLADLGLGYWRAHEKQVPKAILEAPAAIVVSFLQGLFDTDGYATKKYGNVEIGTASRRLAHVLQLLLLNLGMVAGLRKKTTPHRPSYVVWLHGGEAIAFHARVGFRLPHKRARAQLASPLRMPNLGGIPYLAPLLKRIQARIVATPNKATALKGNKSINSIFYTYLPNQRNLSYAKARELIAYCHENQVACPELETLSERHYFYDRVISLQRGRARVYDLTVDREQAYVANGLVSHNSTYLRQVALIVLMAQIGSFVPAESARLGIVDRIFTRIGAEDAISAGQSTFMVEMVETANILHHCSPRSLVVLDEIGRGTSTYDGIAIARAIIEYMHNHPQARAKTLFATHYHELTELEGYLPCVKNYNVAVVEQGDSVVFLHKIVRGGADKSYGIHVAQLAGVPQPVVNRAQEILKELERGDTRFEKNSAPIQLRLFSPDDDLRKEIAALDVMALSPIEALNKLFELQKQAKAK